MWTNGRDGNRQLADNEWPGEEGKLAIRSESTAYIRYELMTMRWHKQGGIWNTTENLARSALLVSGPQTRGLCLSRKAISTLSKRGGVHFDNNAHKWDKSGKDWGVRQHANTKLFSVVTDPTTSVLICFSAETRRGLFLS